MQPDEFQINIAPKIPGLIFRKFRGLSDIRQMWSVRTEAAVTDKIDPQSSRESLPTKDGFFREWSTLPVEASNCIIVEVDGQIIGYNEIMSWTEQDDKKVYLHLGWLLAQWRGQGIGSTMVHLCQETIREMVKIEGVIGKVELATNVSSTERASALLMENEGYKVVHTLSDMVLPSLENLGEVNLPVGLEIRPVLPAHY